MNHMLKRSMSFLLAVLMVLSLMPQLTLWANAAELTGLSDSGIGVEYTDATSSGIVEWSANGTQINGSLKGVVVKPNPLYRASNSTLIITNNKGSDAQLSFDYAVDVTNGSVSIGGDSNIGTAGTYSCELAAGATLEVSLDVIATSKATNASVVITKLSMVVERDTTTTFRKAENGSYTVTDGEGNVTEITADTQLVQSSSKTYTLKATANEGFAFFGWYNVTTDSYISYEEQTAYQSDADQTIVPVFVTDTTAVFEVASAKFSDLNEAVAYAQTNGKTQITLVRSGTITGSYTIPAGIILLIPFNDAYTCYTDMPANTGVVKNEAGVVTGAAVWEEPYAFKTLTMAAGSSITVNGALSVSGQHTAGNSAAGRVSYVGCPTGPVGFIEMAENSQIIVNDGAAAYVWGYIIGDGTVTAKRGAKVYENMQFTDFRGGSATLVLANPEGLGKEIGVFPLSQYYVQNVEVKMTLEAGADEYVYTSLYMQGMALSSGVKFMGDGAMFVPEIGGYITKEYLPDQDRLLIEVSGNAQINSLSLELAGNVVDSSDYTLPINSNITIKINSGKTVVNQNMAMLPGSSMVIAEGAELNIARGWSLYIYDTDDWDRYGILDENGNPVICYGGAFVDQGRKFIPVPYSPTRTYDRTLADLTDVKLDVNGKLTADGYLYTTLGGAAVTSENGTGMVCLNAGLDPVYQAIRAQVGYGVTYQAIQQDIEITPALIPTTSIQLLNGDGSHTATEDAVAGDVYLWNMVPQKWAKLADATVIFDYNGGEGNLENINVSKDQILAGENQVTLPAYDFIREHYTFMGWATTPDGEAVCEPGDTITISGSMTLYAVWQGDPCTVTWVNEQGDVVATEIVEYGKDAVNVPAVPAKEGYNGEWDHDGTNVTGALTIHPVYTIKKYTVTWVDERGNTVATEVVDHGQDAQNVPAVPAKEGYTGQWDQEAKKVTSDLTIKPVYTVITFTVTWVDESGNAVATEVVEYGKDAQNIPAVPAKEGYSGKWDQEAKKVLSDLIIKPVYSIHTYNVAWVDENGDAVAIEVVEYGKDAVNVPAVPAKEGYTGTWDREAKKVTSDLTIKPVYTVITFTVTWVNEQGDVVATETVEYGKDAVNVPAVPAKEGYTGTWDREAKKITSNLTIQPVYTILTFTVKFVDEDGTVLQESIVPYGTVPAYTGEEPAKAATAQYTYTYAGWDKAIVAATADAVYTATYTSTVNEYTVKFVDEDGTVLQEDDIAYGTVPAYNGEEPAKPATAEFTYTFTGWTPAVEAVTGDVVYTAVYEATVNKYTVKFVDENGTVLQESQVPYGTVPAYTGTTPTKAADTEYSYFFAGWTPAVTAVTGDAVYTVVFSTVQQLYTVTWLNADGTLLEIDENVPGGDEPEYNGATPAKEADAQYTYTFTGWTPELGKVAGDVTYVAVYSAAVNEYTVEFVDEDGKVLQSGKVPYGTVPTYNGEEPAKPATAEFTYTFAGWTPAVEAVTGDATYTASFKATRNEYTVKFVDEDGKVLQSGKVPYGTVPTYNGEEPAKPATAEFTYTFTGWTPAVVAVTGDVTYTASFKATRNEYTVKFVDEDGTVLQESIVPYGTVPAYNGEEPAKAANAQYTYTFTGWTPVVEAVTGDITYTAVYKATLNKYTVKFVDDDGTVLQEDVLIYGMMPTYNGEDPVKANTAEYTYTFTGWDKEIVTVTDNTVYTATYSAVVNEYLIRFVDEDGTVLQEGNLPYGTVPTYTGEEPAKTNTAEYTYTFAGWSPAVETVTGDATYTAVYKATVNEYTVKFVNEDGTVLQEIKVPYGTVPTYTGATPEKEATAKYTYTFTGWDKGIVAVTGDAVYTAVYKATMNEYTIKFVDEDGTVLQEEVLKHGMPVKYNGKTPTKAATAEFTYTFAGWTPEVTSVTGDAIYTAVYEATVNEYTVKFIDEDGTVLQESKVPYGTVPVYTGETPVKAADVQYTYTFARWDKEIVAVTGEATYTATYTATINKYTVKFVNEDGTVLQESKVPYGTVPAYTGETPVKEADVQNTYTFAGWDKEIVAVTGDATYTAAYTSTVNKYTVKFVNADGTVLQETQVEYGTVPTYTGETPVKEADVQYSYTFAGWDRELLEVTGDAVYTATYTAVVNEYTVKFVNEDGTVLQESKVAYGTVPEYVGETPVKAETDRYAYTFAGWDKEITAVTGDATYTATYTATEKLTAEWISITTTLSGDIGLNFYARLSEGVLNDETAFIRFTFAGRTLEVPVSEAVVSVKNGENQYRFTCPITSKNMTDEVTAQFMNKDGSIGAPKTMSVDTYCNWIIANYKGNELANLMKGMLNYGAAAQKLFNYRTDDLANAALSEEDKFLPEVDASAYAHVNEGSEEGIKVTSMTLLLDSETTARVYFQLTGDKTIDEFTFVVNGKEVEPTYKNGKYYVEIRNIGAHQLHRMHTVTCGGITVEYAALSYVNQVMNYAASTPETVEMAKALFAYYLAAADYIS